MAEKKTESTSDSNHQILHKAIEGKKAREIYNLIGNGYRPCPKCYISAVQCCSVGIVKTFLIIDPSAVHLRGPNGNTLLMYCDRSEIIQAVSMFKPDPNIRNDNGDNVLTHAIKNHRMYYEMTQSIIDTGVDPNACDKDGNSPLEYALQGKFFQDGVGILIAAGANIPPADKDGRTWLMRYIKRETKYKESNVMSLIKLDTNLHAKDKNGHNAMFYACEALLNYKRANAKDISKILCELLKSKCEIQGFNELTKVSSLHINPLALLEFFCQPTILAERDDEIYLDTFASLYKLCSLEEFSNILSLLVKRKFKIKNVEPETLSPLTVFLLRHKQHTFISNYEYVDRIVAQFLKLEVNVKQRKLIFEEESAKKWSNELEIPDAIWVTLFLDPLDHLEEPEEFFAPLLHFWPQNPQCLLLFPLCDEWYNPPSSSWASRNYWCCHYLKFSTTLDKSIIPKGSRIYNGICNILEKFSDPSKKESSALHLFLQLHNQVPTLYNICRTKISDLLSEAAQSDPKIRRERIKTLPLPEDIKHSVLNPYCKE